MTPYELAQKEVGTVEWADGSNPKVVAYYRDAGHPEVKDDAVAWCAAFVGAMLKRAGLPNTGSLMARSYLKWGTEVPLSDARLGDIVVFKRGTGAQGHVGFFAGMDGAKIKVLGGNQKDAVNVSRYSADSLLGVRRMLSAPQKPAATPTSPPTSVSGALAALLAAIAAAGVAAWSYVEGWFQ